MSRRAAGARARGGYLDLLTRENTAGRGFVASLRTVVDPADRTLVLLGVGGAARASVIEAALTGVASVTIVARNPERAAEIAEVIAARKGAGWGGALDRVLSDPRGCRHRHQPDIGGEGQPINCST